MCDRTTTEGGALGSPWRSTGEGARTGDGELMIRVAAALKRDVLIGVPVKQASGRLAEKTCAQCTRREAALGAANEAQNALVVSMRVARRRAAVLVVVVAGLQSRLDLAGGDGVSTAAHAGLTSGNAGAGSAACCHDGEGEDGADGVHVVYVCGG